MGVLDLVGGGYLGVLWLWILVVLLMLRWWGFPPLLELVLEE